MTCSILILLLVTAQDRPKPDTPEARARRAALVDRVMAEPSPPDLRPRRPAAAEVPEDGRPQAAQNRNRDENPFENEKPKVFVPPALFGFAGAQPRRYLTLESVTPAPVEDDELNPPEVPPPAQPVLNVHNAILGRENFDRWLFGDDFGEGRRRPFLYGRLVVRVDLAAQELRLTVPQKEKLRLSGVGDIKRFFDRVEEMRQDFELARRDLTAGRRVLTQLLTLSDEFRLGPFGDDSLFAKTLRKMENDSLANAKQGR